MRFVALISIFAAACVTPLPASQEDAFDEIVEQTSSELRLARPDEIAVAAQKVYTAFSTGVFTGPEGFFGLMNKDVEFCGGASSYEYPFVGCYIGLDSTQAVLFSPPPHSIRGLALRDLTVSHDTAYLRITEDFTWSATGVDGSWDTLWALRFRKVGNKLEVANFDFFFRDTALPIVGAPLVTTRTRPATDAATVREALNDVYAQLAANDSASFYANLADDVVYCAGSTSTDDPARGCYQGKAKTTATLSAINYLGRKSIRKVDVATHDISAQNGQTDTWSGYLRVRERRTFTPVDYTHPVDIIWAVGYEDVGGALRIGTFDSFIRLADLPRIRVAR